MKLSSIAEKIAGKLIGPDCEISGIASPKTASSGHLLVVRSDKFLDSARSSGASLVVDRPIESALGYIQVDSVSEIWPSILKIFDVPDHWGAPGVDPLAKVSPLANVDPSASVEAFCVIEDGATIGAGVVLAPRVYIARGVKVGEGTVIEPGVTVYRDVLIGRNCLIGSGTSLGHIGFGFEEPVLKRLAHTGAIEIGDNVEIGSNCSMQRGLVGNSTIGNGCKIGDAMVFGHNFQIGKNVAMIGVTSLGGSVTIGNDVSIMGGCVISDHITIGNRVTLLGSSAVGRDIPEGETWAGGIPSAPARQHWRRIAIWEFMTGAAKELKKLVSEKE